MSAGISLVAIVAGRSGTGKTTLMEKLIAALMQRGYAVGAIKSDAHGFEIDQPGKDTWRFSRAGARATAIIGPQQYALIQRTEEKKDVHEIAALMQGVDIILAEGFKSAAVPRIEVVRRELGTTLVSPLPHLVAVATDIRDLAAPVPVFALDDIEGIADFIERMFLKEHASR